jgi:hypothetical protein
MQFVVGPNSTIKVSQTNDTLTISEWNRKGNLIREIKAHRSLSRILQNEQNNQWLRNVRFAEPMDLKNHPVIKYW